MSKFKVGDVLYSPKSGRLVVVVSVLNSDGSVYAIDFEDTTHFILADIVELNCVKIGEL